MMGDQTKTEMLNRLLKKLAIKEQRRAPLPARMAVGLLAVRHHRLSAAHDAVGQAMPRIWNPVGLE